MAPDQGGFQHRGRKAVLPVLEYQPHLLRDKFAPNFRQRFAIQKELAVAGFPETRQCMQQCGFTHTIGAKNAPDLARLQGQIQGHTRGTSGNVDDQLFGSQYYCHYRLR